MRFFFGFTLVILIVSGSCTAQSVVSDDILYKYYSREELDSLEVTDNQEYLGIIYYFNYSYSVQSVSCSDCLRFDPYYFDVFQYEKMREADVQFERLYEKLGFRLKLFSYSSLTYPLPMKMVELKSQFYSRNVLVKSIE